MDVTQEVKALIEEGATVETRGYLCIQGNYSARICSGCTSACDQSVVVVIPATTPVMTPPN